MTKVAVTSILVAVVLLAVGVIAEAQQPKKVHRIGYLSPRDAATESTRSEAIRRALRERSYIEGQNISTEYRYAEGKVDWVPQLVAELVRLKSCADWDSSSRYLLLSPMKQSFTSRHKNGFFRSRYSLKV